MDRADGDLNRRALRRLRRSRSLLRLLFHESSKATTDDEVARINAVAGELNREAEDVLEYQVSS